MPPKLAPHGHFHFSKPEYRQEKLVVSNLTKVYETRDKRIPALSNINLEVNSREFVSIIGPNASGKSTLLKIIAGILKPTSGAVSIDGEIAYMPQEHALLPWRTIEENLLLPSDIRGIPRATQRKKISDLLHEFGFLRYAPLYPSSLSGGTRQRIALLRTVLHDHSLLLLDEPFAPLDALTRLAAQDWLLKLVGRRQPSVLLITHDIREAIFLSDTIYVLESVPGRVRDKIPVSLPKPRTHEALGTPEAIDLEKRLFSLLLPKS